VADANDAERKALGAPGRAVTAASWLGVGVFAATSVPSAAGVDAFENLAVVVALVLFFASLLVWAYTFVAAAARSANGDHIAVGNLFLIEGDVPRLVRRSLFGSVAVCLAVTAATASSEPFGVLVPMWPLGMVGLWGARHGVFPLRRDVAEGSARPRASIRRSPRP
jgi:hypothetical protein